MVFIPATCAARSGVPERTSSSTWKVPGRVVWATFADKVRPLTESDPPNLLRQGSSGSGGGLSSVAAMESSSATPRASTGKDSEPFLRTDLRPRSMPPEGGGS